MNELFRLLELKNFWFKRFLLICERFVVTLEKDTDAAIEELELFDQNRSSLIKIITGTDEKIQALLEEPAYARRTPSSEDQTRLQYFMREKDSILNQIIKLDSGILAKIELLQKKQQEELNSVGKRRSAVAKFKSGIEQNRELDKQA